MVNYNGEVREVRLVGSLILPCLLARQGEFDAQGVSYYWG